MVRARRADWRLPLSMPNALQTARSMSASRTLRALEVSERGPGTILRDFEALLSFVRERKLHVWFSAVRHREDRRVSPLGVPAPASLGARHPILGRAPGACLSIPATRSWTGHHRAVRPVAARGRASDGGSFLLHTTHVHSFSG